MSDYLTDNYNLTDHREDEKYKDWNDFLVAYEEEKQYNGKPARTIGTGLPF